MEHNVPKPRFAPALEIQIVTRPGGGLQSLKVSVGGAAVSADLKGSHSGRFGCEPGMSAMVAGDTSALTAVEDKQSRLRVFSQPND